MQHQCADCDHKFFDAGQSQDSISPAVQCPQCHSYRTQPAGIPDESNEMLHGLQSLPTSTTPDGSGNALQTGILAGTTDHCRFCNSPLDPYGQCVACDQPVGHDPSPSKHNDFQMDGVALQGGDPPDGGWKNRSVRDESFAASVRRSGFPSLFEGPEFETTQLVAPPDLYRHGMESEATHRAGLQLPNGITDNLHAALGNLQAWVENPYENGELRPYYNKYWKVIRPSFMKPGALQIGVADPTMAEIINHVAQTDDLTPLYEYRGQDSHKTALWAALAAPFAGLLGGGLTDAAGAGLAAGVGEVGGAGALATGGGELAAGGAGEAAANSAASAGGIMSPVMRGAQFQIGNQAVKRIAPVLGLGDDVVGMGGGGGANGPSGGINDASFYSRMASDEDDAFPDSHDEIPKNEDGDHKQQDDGNNHEWQRDISVNGIGGAEHSPSFDPAGSGFQRFVMMLPLLLQYMQSGEDGSQDPLVQALHETLDQEIPGYLDHADPEAGQRLIMMVEPHLKGGKPEPEKNEPTHADENAGGAHESRAVSLTGDAAEFLPDLTVTPPALRGLSAMYPHRPSEIPSGVISGPLYPEEEALESSSWPKAGPEACPYCGHYAKMALGGCAGCGKQVYADGQAQAQALGYGRTAADTQGPHTPEQIQAVQQWLMHHGSELGLEGDELIQTVLSVPTNPLDFADVLSKIQNAEPPPDAPDAGGMSASPPMPPMEQAPPGATMPVPGMEQQMMSAVQRYSADSIAGKCPKCGSHTTELLSDEDGTSRCHACNNTFKTEGTADKVHPGQTTASTWNVDEDLRKEADAEAVTDSADTEPVKGVPIADQSQQRDLRAEQDSGHTWTDEDGNPLKVGQEYEMYSQKYDIPDLARIEAVKPHAIVYTLTGEFGLEHSTELTKEEANIEQVTFRSTAQDGEVDQADDSFEQNNDDNTAYTGEPEHRDMSAPSGLVAASVVASGVAAQANPSLAWLRAEMPHTAGASYTPMEQRALIEEQGSARNSDLLDLVGTHYIDGADEDQFLFGY